MELPEGPRPQAACGRIPPSRRRVRELWAVWGRDDGHGRETARPSAWDRTRSQSESRETAHGTPMKPVYPSRLPAPARGLKID